MINTTLFSDFTRVLSSDSNSFKIFPEAFGMVAEFFNLASIRYHFSVSDTRFTPGGAESAGELFSGKASSVCPKAALTIDYHTGENGFLSLSAYTLEGSPVLTDEQQAALRSLMEIAVMHLGRYRLAAQALKNSLSDYMTGLPNADGFMKYALELQRAGKIFNYNSYYFNLRGFGLVNRRFGQKETDEIIKRYANILKDFTREGEVVGRLGGDNFVALILKERTDDFIKLISGVKTYGKLNGEEIPIVIPAVAGVYEIGDDIKDCEPLISKSAVALSAAKNIFKKPIMFATPELDDHIFQQKKCMAKFPDAIANEEFAVYYQPKVSTTSYEIVGAEALVRWISDGKVISPGNFIPIFEQNGNICQLDFYMLEHSCRHIRSWIDAGITPVRISLNFSRKHLSNPNLANDIIEIVESYHIPPEYIEVEVTETISETEQGILVNFLNELKAHNITTAIDDFGTGYSSLDILRTLPIDVLKIDKSFIDGESITQKDSIVLSHIIRMARELKMDVITEGVEHWSQVNFLKDMDCNMVQGFLFDKPVPEPEFREKLVMKQYDISQIKDFEYKKQA
jgi:diguanylate cyclase (GGDEF)-like protein